jgi:hypothetical protein
MDNVTQMELPATEHAISTNILKYINILRDLKNHITYIFNLLDNVDVGMAPADIAKYVAKITTLKQSTTDHSRLIESLNVLSPVSTDIQNHLDKIASLILTSNMYKTLLDTINSEGNKLEPNERVRALIAMETELKITGQAYGLSNNTSAITLRNAILSSIVPMKQQGRILSHAKNADGTMSMSFLYAMPSGSTTGLFKSTNVICPPTDGATTCNFKIENGQLKNIGGTKYQNDDTCFYEITKRNSDKSGQINTTMCSTNTAAYDFKIDEHNRISYMRPGTDVRRYLKNIPGNTIITSDTDAICTSTNPDCKFFFETF